MRRNDRLVGAALYCIEQGVDPEPIVEGIRAALKFDREGDVSAPELQKALKEQAIDYCLLYTSWFSAPGRRRWHNRRRQYPVRFLRARIWKSARG